MTDGSGLSEAGRGELGEFYHRDHERLDLLWAEFLSLRTKDADGARRIFEAFRQGLERHMAWEDELLFFEFARRVDDRGKLVATLLTWEHQGLRRWLARLVSHLGATDGEFDLECVAFAGMLAGHNRREETLVYPLVNRLLTAQEAAQLRIKMETR